MRINISCNLEADIIDKEESDSIKEILESKNARDLKNIKLFWRRLIETAFRDICTEPIYQNKKINCNVSYEENNSTMKTKCNVDDTVYCINCGYTVFEDTIHHVCINTNNEMVYCCSDFYFSESDVGK